jgi:protein gp37
MGATKIPYLDKVYNPVIGCSPKMPCAARCWAVKTVDRMACIFSSSKSQMAQRRACEDVLEFSGLGACWSGRSALVESWLDAPLHWRKPQRIGVCFLGDLFAEAVPDEWIDRVFAVMALCPQHQFYVLSKQAAKMKAQIERLSKSIAPVEKAARDMGYTFKFTDPDTGRERSTLPFPFPNVRLGVSVCNQAEADERIPLLLQTPAAFRWVSIEPMVSEIDFGDLRFCEGCGKTVRSGSAVDAAWHQTGMDMCGPMTARLDWVVVGCESGLGRRPMPWSWAERVVEQCKAANVPCWIKQLDKGSRGVIHPGSEYWPAWARQEQPA